MYRNIKIIIKLGKNIAEHRKQKGISQEELGYIIHSARNYIGCIERGEKSPSITTLHKIAEALGINVKDLINF